MPALRGRPQCCRSWLGAFGSPLGLGTWRAVMRRAAAENNSRSRLRELPAKRGLRAACAHSRFESSKSTPPFSPPFSRPNPLFPPESAFPARIRENRAEARCCARRPFHPWTRQRRLSTTWVGPAPASPGRSTPPAPASESEPGHSSGFRPACRCGRPSHANRGGRAGAALLPRRPLSQADGALGSPAAGRRQRPRMARQ